MAFANCPGCSSRMVAGVCPICGFAVATTEVVLSNESNANQAISATQTEGLNKAELKAVYAKCRGLIIRLLSRCRKSGPSAEWKNRFGYIFIAKVAIYIVLGLLAVPAGRLLGFAITYQLDAPRRALEAKSEKELAEARAKDQLKYEAEKKRTDEQYATIQRYLATLQERYAKAVENADIQAANEVMDELQRIKTILGPTEQEKAAARRAAIIARYQAKLDKLLADYQEAKHSGDQAAADHALSEAAALYKLAKEIE